MERSTVTESRENTWTILSSVFPDFTQYIFSLKWIATQKRKYEYSVLGLRDHHDSRPELLRCSLACSVKILYCYCIVEMHLTFQGVFSLEPIFTIALEECILRVKCVSFCGRAHALARLPCHCFLVLWSWGGGSGACDKRGIMFFIWQHHHCSKAVASTLDSPVQFASFVGMFRQSSHACDVIHNVYVQVRLRFFMATKAGPQKPTP